MRIPMQSMPVSRNVSTQAYEGINGSGILDVLKKGARWAACKACKFACSKLPVGGGLCRRACDRTVC
jgi:hypothetical protein